VRRWTIPELEWITPAVDRDAVLAVDSLGVRYGRRPAVHDVSLHVRAGEVVGLVGHNGSGKTSVLRVAAGLAEPATGTVTVQVPAGADATVRYVPTTRPVFADLSVRDNLWLGAGPMAPVARNVRVEEVLALFPELAGRLDEHAGVLSGGEQRLVSIGIALMVRPELLLVDEPTQFLAPAAAARVLRTLRSLADDGVGVLMAETSVAAAAHIADRVYVLNSGRVRSEHTGGELRTGGPRSWWRLL
jgi:branched-chain amino acid transport system ATP-binding protein